MKTKILKSYFVGGSSKRGMIFNQIHSTTRAYLYEINDNGLVHYETFKRRKVALCVNFEKREYSTTNFKDVYPKDNDFGIWAWCYNDKEKAIDKFNELDKIEREGIDG